MQLRNLGSTGVKVSPLCLGAMMFGDWGNTDHDESMRIIHAALDAGINFIDTADVYSRGESEQIVGQALKGRRDRIWELAALDHQGGREQPPPTANGLDRPVPDPPPRRGHEHRRDARCAERPRSSRQGALHRLVDVPAVADSRGTVGGREAWARALRL